MPALRSRFAALLLVAFVTGGLVAPAVHHAGHNRAWDDARAAFAAHPEHVHDGETGWTEGLDAHFESVCCWLCAPLAFGPRTAPALAHSAPLEAAYPALARALVTDRVPEAAPSRGPPALA